jgi:hypothetical protein
MNGKKFLEALIVAVLVAAFSTFITRPIARAIVAEL